MTKERSNSRFSTLERLDRALEESLDLSLDPAGGNLWVAYSGGSDSAALLHAMQRLLRIRDPDGKKWRLQVCHVHHGLQSAADAMAEEASKQCRQLGLNCRVLYAKVDLRSGQGGEGSAREARYALLLAQMGASPASLWTAHHRTDQAETLILALKRGSGILGLSGMEVRRKLNRHHDLCRPWIDQPKSAIDLYRSHHHLSHVDDPSNRLLCHDRNFIRHHLTPICEKRWPEWVDHLAKSARLCRESQEAFEILLSERLRSMVDATQPGMGLSIAQLAELDPPLRRALLRCWLRPERLSEAQLHQLWQSVAQAHPSANPLLDLRRCSLRRHRNRLVKVPPASTLHTAPSAPLFLPEQPGRFVRLPYGLGEVTWFPLDAAQPWTLKVIGPTPATSPRPIGFTPRNRGESPWSTELSVRPLTSLDQKKRFQALNIPIWLREWIPTLPQPHPHTDTQTTFQIQWIWWLSRID